MCSFSICGNSCAIFFAVSLLILIGCPVISICFLSLCYTYRMFVISLQSVHPPRKNQERGRTLTSISLHLWVARAVSHDRHHPARTHHEKGRRVIVEQTTYEGGTRP